MTKHTVPPTLLDRWWPWIVRFLGVGIAIYETVLEHADRPSLLLLAAGCLGLPEFIKFDRSRHKGEDK